MPKMLLFDAITPEPVLQPDRAFCFKPAPMLAARKLSMKSIFTIPGNEFLIKFS